MTTLIANGATVGDGIVAFAGAFAAVGCAWAFFWFLKNI